MKHTAVPLIFILILAILAGCSSPETPISDNLMVEPETPAPAPAPAPEPEPAEMVASESFSTLDVMDYVTTSYPEYNTFVFIDKTVHIMNCPDAPNRTMLELAREISSITSSSYEALSIQTVEHENRYISRRIDYIAVEDSDGVWNHNTNETIAFYQEDVDSLQGIYDQYEVVVNESVPGSAEWIREKDATLIVSELMGYVDTDMFGGFINLLANNNEQVFIFALDTFGQKYNKETLETLCWDPTDPSAVTPEAFIQDMLYGEPNSDSEYLHILFMDYELFYGPQTTEQMRSVLEEFKGLVKETVYNEFGNSFDHAVLEATLQSAYAEMDEWWGEYSNK